MLASEPTSLYTVIMNNIFRTFEAVASIIRIKLRPKSLATIIVLLCFIVIDLSNLGIADNSDEQFGHNLLKSMNEVDHNKRAKMLEQILKGANSYQRYFALPHVIKTRIRIEHYEKAGEYAQELLTLAEKYKGDWNYGNAIHDANMVLGLIALKSNSIASAKTHLLKAGNAPGSPQIKAFGPCMLLANALLDIGETEIVIEYLQLLKKSWENNGGRLNSWIYAIKGGGKPYFGANLSF